MNPLSLQTKLIVVIALVATAFGAGWKVKSWQVDSRDLAIAQAKDAMITVFRDAERAHSRILEDKLADLKANEKVIEREKFRIIDRPVYLNNCLDGDGVRLIENARSGTTDTAKLAD